MFSKLFKLTFLSLSAAAVSLPLRAADVTNCYNITVTSPIASPKLTPRVERWCYQHLSDPAGTLYIFNADGLSAKPELALLLDKDGIITHGSLLMGELTVHRVRASDFNPFSIPLKEPKNMPSTAFFSPRIFSLASVDDTKNYLLSQSHSLVESMTMSAPTLSASANYLPWRGFWWPYNGLPLAGPFSEYDNFVGNHSGTNPGATNWERNHHYYQGISWEGHCNGWAASAIIRPEPRATHYDSATGTSFSVADQKGILAEIDYCVSTAFYGVRGSGMNPADFHKTLLYYIGQLHKPVAIDPDPAPPISNNIASAYTITMQPTGTSSYDVTARVTVHTYDNFATNSPGAAPSGIRTYKYSLILDANGNPSTGAWEYGSPGFMWAPLGPSRCNANNPQLDSSWLDAIQALPVE